MKSRRKGTGTQNQRLEETVLELDLEEKGKVHPIRRDKYMQTHTDKK